MSTQQMITDFQVEELEKRFEMGWVEYNPCECQPK
ncbi:hypothetical protein HNP38_001318 [Chryseobacterium defluvii]|uniref:Uncharacterized protein n=1 Tax=Chryseobacterium defluvii TaxID=160396 RepID=A0A840KA02_9FLAO|nr:hypothetical protein [Chryseobacterium defluvii]